MENELDFLKTVVIFNKDEQEIFDAFISSCGIDKSLEIYHNYKRLTGETKVDVKTLVSFLGYEYQLSTILFSILRIHEDAIKAFLCNTFNGVKVNIESRPSNYSKTKYYFKIPVKNGSFLDIRTFSYNHGPVDYYDALKTMDFGDINLIMSKLDNRLLSRFSTNPNILKELDATRQIRNYVYHHNLLFSIDKKDLTNAIAFTLKNLPLPLQKSEYINLINSLRFQGENRDFDIGEKIAIEIDSDLEKLIFVKR